MRFKFLMRPNRRELCLILAAALGYCLAFPNPFIQLPPLILLTPPCLALLALEAESRARAVFFCFLSMLLGASLALYWLAIPMHNFGGVPWVLAAFFVSLLGLIYGLHGLLFGLAARFFAARLPFWAALIGLALTWGALEYGRGWFLTGFPWLSLASAFAGWPLLAQGAALLGMYGLGAFYCLPALLLGLLCLKTPADQAALFSGGQPAKAQPRRGLMLGLSLLLLGGISLYGALRLEHNWQTGPARLITLVQGNTEQVQKWTADYRKKIINDYLELSKTALRTARADHGRSPDLLIWPETAMPFVFQRSPNYALPIRQLVRESGVPLLFGTQGLQVNPEKEPYPELGPIMEEAFNRVLLLDRLGRESGSYDKEHLVPFGEYLPPWLYIPFASEFLQGTGFTPGQADPAPLESGDLRLGMLICYEVIFPELAQARVAAGANILVTVSNDAWFGHSAAPAQHLQLAAMRCIEQGRYLARGTNTGISAVVDPCGRVDMAGPLFQPFSQTVQVWPSGQNTFFHRYYNWINAALYVIPLLLGLWALARHRKKQNA